MPQRLIAIGDIHGCAAALNTLMEEIRPGSDDLLVMLGDYVDRGPETRQVIDRLLEIRQQLPLVTLMGNHELMMIDSYEDHSQAFYWLQCGGQATLQSYGGSPTNVPQEHLEFVRNCQPYHETEKHFFVHANYNPRLPLAEQPQTLLYWTHLHDQFPEPHVSGKTAVVGHTPQKTGEVLKTDHLVCLDTYCVGNGWLTAMEMYSGQVWQANKAGQLRIPDPPTES